MGLSPEKCQDDGLVAASGEIKGLCASYHNHRMRKQQRNIVATSSFGRKKETGRGRARDVFAFGGNADGGFSEVRKSSIAQLLLDPANSLCPNEESDQNIYSPILMSKELEHTLFYKYVDPAGISAISYII
jgi:hypothetical protein